jgi:pyrroloquinoline-quinone synthase
MDKSGLEFLVAEVLSGRQLLAHPFYRRWEAGELHHRELAAYAGQYRHFEGVLPDVLEALVASVADPARGRVQSNLDDERGNPVPHLVLFDQFTAAVGGSVDAPPTPATTALVSLYQDMAASDPVAALAALAAYEVQSPAIAQSKGDGLRRHYGLDVAQTRFWDVHAAADVDHANWTLEALSAVASYEDQVRPGVDAGAAAWWAFLDERQAQAPEAPDQAA